MLESAAHSEKLVALAADWRERANRTTDLYHSDVLRRAAEQLERTAARGIGNGPAPTLRLRGDAQSREP